MYYTISMMSLPNIFSFSMKELTGLPSARATVRQVTCLQNKDRQDLSPFQSACLTHSWPTLFLGRRFPFRFQIVDALILQETHSVDGEHTNDTRRFLFHINIAP